MNLNLRRTDATPEPLLYRWDDMVLSFSETIELKPHFHGAAELVISLGNPVRCHLGNGESVRAMSLLIPPNVAHQNRYTDPLSATVYFDVDSRYYEALADEMDRSGAVFASTSADATVRSALIGIYREEPDVDECMARICGVLFDRAHSDGRVIDPRVQSVAQAIRRDPTRTDTVSEFAGLVGLSEDRLHHLFTADFGIPIHKYRVWLRLKQASRCYFEGHTLTYAAHDAGFTDAAHFSRTFAKMYGSPPQAMLSARRDARVHFS